MTKNNPSDSVLRRTEASQLIDKTLWCRRPHWLSKTEELWPVAVKTSGETVFEKKERKQRALKTSQSQAIIQFERFSNFNRLLRTICYCNRFLKKLKNASTGASETIDTQELLVALTQPSSLHRSRNQHDEKIRTLPEEKSAGITQPIFRQGRAASRWRPTFTLRTARNCKPPSPIKRESSHYHPLGKTHTR